MDNLTEINRKKLGGKEPQKVGVEMKVNKISQSSIKRMDDLAVLFTAIYKYVDQVKMDLEKLPHKENIEMQVKSRAFYEIGLGETHLEDALMRFSRGIQYLPTGNEDKNGGK